MRSAPRLVRRSLVVAAVAVLAPSLTGVAPAGAAGVPSRATAQAVWVPGLGVTTPMSAADNDGTQPTQESGYSTSDPSVVTAGWGFTYSGGVVGQAVRAEPDGSTAACAGLLATGSTLALATDGTCDFGAGGPGSTVRLPGAVITSGDVVAACAADGGRSRTGSTTLRGVSVAGPGGEDPVAFPESPEPGTVVRAHGYVFILGEELILPEGRIRVTAMYVWSDTYRMSGSTGVVTCGPWLPVVAASAFPLGGPPVLAALAAVAAGAVAGRAGRSRRRAAGAARSGVT